MRCYEQVYRGVDVDGAGGGHHVGEAARECAHRETADTGGVDYVDGAVVFVCRGDVLAAGVEAVAFAYVQVAVGIGLEAVVVGIGTCFGDAYYHVGAVGVECHRAGYIVGGT